MFRKTTAQPPSLVSLSLYNCDLVSDVGYNGVSVASLSTTKDFFCVCVCVACVRTTLQDFTVLKDFIGKAPLESLSLTGIKVPPAKMATLADAIAMCKKLSTLAVVCCSLQVS